MFGTVNFINVPSTAQYNSTAEGHVNKHKSSILVADGLQRECYCNFQGPDYHLGNFKNLEHCMATVAKCQWKRSEYAINIVDPDYLKHHRLLVAFEHCLNVTAFLHKVHDQYDFGRFQQDNSRTNKTP